MERISKFSLLHLNTDFNSSKNAHKEQEINAPYYKHGVLFGRSVSTHAWWGPHMNAAAIVATALVCAGIYKHDLLLMDAIVIPSSHLRLLDRQYHPRISQKHTRFLGGTGYHRSYKFFARLCLSGKIV